MAEKMDVSRAWDQYLTAHPEIEEAVRKKGFQEVTAKSIKEYFEPRNMTKHDSREGVPQPLSQRGLNILSASRSSYYIGDFDVFEDFPDTSDLKPEFCELPWYETLRVDNITTESNAINALLLGGILDKFLRDYDTAETFNGRMGSGDFEYAIARANGSHIKLAVHGAQLEIDGGFENEHSVIIMEAKNVIHGDFNVRQLYYPFRKYSELVTKPIRLVFSQYTNLTYNLFEYEFADPMDYSSITLLRKAAYTFEEDRITDEDVWWQWQGTKVLYDDYEKCIAADVPFPQADRIDRIFALLEFLAGKPDGASTAEITELMGTVERQAAYYPTAGRYLGLFEKPKRNLTVLTDRARDLLKLRRSDRMLRLASFIFEHKIFHELYDISRKSGKIPERDEVVEYMKELRVLDGGADVTVRRRASTVTGWLRWLFELPDEE